MSPDYSILERQASQPRLGRKGPINSAVVNFVFKDSEDNSQKHKVKYELGGL